MAVNASTRDDFAFLARVCEQVERFEDMRDFVKKMLLTGNELSITERHLFSVAYKNVVGHKRAAWRALSTLELKESARGALLLDRIKNYRVQVETEVRDLCNEVIGLVSKHILPVTSNPEGRVYYLKLQADYQRYVAEVTTGGDHSTAADAAHESYKQASDIALNELAPTDPTRLGLALNFSVFYYEVLVSPERACLLAKAAFDDAIAVMDMLEDEHYKDSATIMQLLRDNLTLWTSDMVATTATGTSSHPAGPKP